jgi:cation diffusion facilitator family transporter
VHPKLRVAAISIVANAALVSIELAVAAATGSLSVLVDAFHSGVDLTGSLVALAGIRMALRVADRDHGYGYGRYENAAALIQFVLIAMIGVVVIQEAVRRYLFGFHVEVTPLALVVVLGTTALDIALFRYIAQRGRTLQSSALEADSYHFGTDAVGKIGVLIGMGAAYAGYPVMDLFGAVAIAIVFIAAAYLMGRKNLRILADASPPQELVTALRSAAQAVPGVTEVHSLRSRVSGHHVLVDLVVHVPAEMSLMGAHETAHAVEEAIRNRVPNVAEVIVHAEPDRHERRLDETHAS